MEPVAVVALAGSATVVATECWKSLVQLTPLALFGLVELLGMLVVVVAVKRRLAPVFVQ